MGDPGETGADDPAATPKAAAEPARIELTIDELAQRAGMTVRNIRSYQDKQLIPPPERRGRVGVYGDAHLLRLRAIGHLLGRGYNLGNIRELLEAWDQGRAVADAMGLEQVLSGPWTTEVPVHTTLEELVARFGPVSPAVLERALDLGYLEVDGERLRVPMPSVLHVTEALLETGVPLLAALEEAQRLRAAVREIAVGFARLVIRHLITEPYGEDGLPPVEDQPRVAASVARLRPMAQTIVSAELARNLEEVVHEQLGERLASALEASLEGDDSG